MKSNYMPFVHNGMCCEILTSSSFFPKGGRAQPGGMLSGTVPIFCGPMSPNVLPNNQTFVLLYKDGIEILPPDQLGMKDRDFHARSQPRPTGEA
jgi:hypothetical protein